MKEKAKNVLIKKEILKVKNTLRQWILPNILKKSDISENSKVYYGRFLRNGLHERYCYISKKK